MARREKDVDMPRRGNFKGGMGQTSATGGAKPKKTRGIATTEAVKKMKQRESSMAKPRAKPSKPAKPAAAMSGATNGSPMGKVRTMLPAPLPLPLPPPKTTTRSLSPKPQKRSAFRKNLSLDDTARVRAAGSRTGSNYAAMRGAASEKANAYRKSQKSKPQSRSGEMVLGGGPNTAQAAKIRKSQEPKTTVKAKTKSRYERRKTSSAKSSTVGDWFRRNFGTASMRNK